MGAGRLANIGIPSPDVMGPLVGVIEITCGAKIRADEQRREARANEKYEVALKEAKEKIAQADTSIARRSLSSSSSRWRHSTLSRRVGDILEHVGAETGFDARR